MKLLRFTKLSLLSNKERRGLQIDLSAPATVLVAGNGYGKSAILKSLYDALGARPHKIDKKWRDASVISLLEFSLDGRGYSALKVGNTYNIYDERRKLLLGTDSVGRHLGPFLAELLSFKLVLTNRQDEVGIPPPSYMFAPFYVDQDVGWQKPWSSFSDLGMYPNAAKHLAEYHIGIRPNSYYEAKAERDRLKSELKNAEEERQAVDQALRKIVESMPTLPLSFDIEEFKDETERLLREGQVLHDTQSKYRKELVILNEELRLWLDHVAVVESGLAEMNTSWHAALHEKTDVECPTCGQHYSNKIADQFELVSDIGELLHAVQIGRQKIVELEAKIRDRKSKIDSIQAAINRVNEILAIHREDLTLGDIIKAKGRNEARRIMQDRLSSLDDDVNRLRSRIAFEEQRMAENESKQRKQNIAYRFSMLLEQFTSALDVQLAEMKGSFVQGLNIGRGSVQPRALASYYYAFLHTAREYGSSAFCPIVIDAPNQQGQDAEHLERIIKFLLTTIPLNGQVIIGAESIPDSWGAKVIDVTWKKDQVLREDLYEETFHYISPYLTQAEL